MSVRVVHRLEVIDVEHDHRELVVMTQRERGRTGEIILECSPRIGAGETVAVGEPAKLQLVHHHLGQVRHQLDLPGVELADPHVQSAERADVLSIA
jgi:hypothetical protein